LPGNKAQKSSHLSTILEGVAAADGTNQGGRRQRTDTRDRHQTPASVVVFCRRVDGSLNVANSLIELAQVFVEPSN